MGRKAGFPLKTKCFQGFFTFLFPCYKRLNVVYKSPFFHYSIGQVIIMELTKRTGVCIMNQAAVGLFNAFLLSIPCWFGIVFALRHLI